MNTTQIKNFIKAGEKIFPYFTRPKMLLYTFGVDFFMLISAFFVKMLSPIARVISVAFYAFLVLFTVCSVFCVIKPLTLKTRVIYWTSLCSFMSLTFLLDSIVFCDMADVPYYGIIYVVPVCLAIFSIYIMHPKFRIKKGSKGNVTVWIVPTIAVSGSGFWMGRAFRSVFAQMAQPVLNVVLAVGLYVLGCLLSLGSFGFLYLHYIRVLESKGINLDD